MLLNLLSSYLILVGGVGVGVVRANLCKAVTPYV
jgi:hypothetical protein